MAIAVRRSRYWLASVMLFILVVTSGLSHPAVAVADTSDCATQQAALDDVHARIDEHNSRSRGSGPPEIVRPYNAEADRLDAEQAANLGSLHACQRAVGVARVGGPAPRTQTPETLSEIANATAASRPRWPTAGPVTRLADGKVTIPKGHPLRPLWDVIKGLQSPMRPYPNVPLQGQPRPAIGDQHPSGYTVGNRTNKRGDEPAVSPDHIVPKVEILFLPRFLDLTPENMWEVINAPMNLQWLPSEVNERIKNSRSAADMKGVDAQWQNEQIALQDQKRRELTDLIAQLADSQLPKR